MMSLEESIKHCEMKALENQQRAERAETPSQRDQCLDCASDHEQLASWLKELKELRETKKLVILKINEKVSAQKMKMIVEILSEQKERGLMFIPDFMDVFIADGVEIKQEEKS